MRETIEVTDLPEGCGCKLCKAPVLIPKYSDEERALRVAAWKDYRKQMHTLTTELLARNAHKA